MVIQGNDDVAKDWTQLSPVQPLIPPTNFSPRVHPPDAHCPPPTHKSECVNVKVKGDGQGSETIFLEVKQEYEIKVPAVHPFTRGSLSSLSA